MSSSSVVRSRLRNNPQPETKPLLYKDNDDVSFWTDAKGWWWYGTYSTRCGPFETWDHLIVAWEREAKL